MVLISTGVGGSSLEFELLSSWSGGEGGAGGGRGALRNSI
jgi:hypothetical protein